MTQQLHRRGALWAIALAAAASLALAWVPGLEAVAWPLLLFSTLAHEAGHGLAALSTGAQFESLSLYLDGSGVAAYRGHFNAFERAYIAAGGLLGPPAAACLLLLAGRRSRPAHVALALLALFVGLLALLWAGTVFTLVFCLAWAALLGLLAWRGGLALCQVACVFLALQLALASFSRADYLFTASADTGQGRLPSDVGQIAAALWLPYWLWGGVIALLSLVLLAIGIVGLLRTLR